jgi:hypothetical protein
MCGARRGRSWCWPASQASASHGCCRKRSPRALAAGLSVLAGGCRQRGGQEPSAPLLAALADHRCHLPVAQARQALRGCDWLVRQLPELAGG